MFEHAPQARSHEPSGQLVSSEQVREKDKGFCLGNLELLKNPGKKKKNVPSSKAQGLKHHPKQNLGFCSE